MRIRKLILVFISILALSFQADDRFIYWDENRPLKWSDFKGPYPKHSKITVAANTFSDFNHNAWKEKDHYLFRVRALFRTDGSYTIFNDGEDPYTLKHEQYHFNITEIYARKMRKDITDSIHLLNKWDENKYINYFVIKYYWVKDKAQKKYDEETTIVNGIDTLKQKQWEETIDVELTKLSAYKSAEIKVPFTSIKGK